MKKYILVYKTNEQKFKPLNLKRDEMYGIPTVFSENELENIEYFQKRPSKLQRLQKLRPGSALPLFQAFGRGNLTGSKYVFVMVAPENKVDEFEQLQQELKSLTKQINELAGDLLKRRKEVYDKLKKIKNKV